MTTILRIPNGMGVQHVRDAINERARNVGASDEVRREALALAFRLLDKGHSRAWAVAEACRKFAAKPPVKHGGYPDPTLPGAA